MLISATFPFTSPGSDSYFGMKCASTSANLIQPDGITASFSWSLTEGVWGRFLLCGKNDLYHSCYVWKKLYFCRKI